MSEAITLEIVCLMMCCFTMVGSVSTKVDAVVVSSKCSTDTGTTTSFVVRLSAEEQKVVHECG